MLSEAAGLSCGEAMLRAIRPALGERVYGRGREDTFMHACYPGGASTWMAGWEGTKAVHTYTWCVDGINVCAYCHA